MKGIIIYKGKYGATSQYAKWLGTALQLPVIEPENMTGENLSKYDYVIIGSSVYVGKLQLRDWVRSYEPVLQTQKVYFFIVCGTPAEEKDKIAEIVRNNVPESLRYEENIYILRGRMIKKDLSWLDRIILKMGARMQKDQAEGQRMLQDFDEVRKENLNPLIKGVQALKSNFMHVKIVS